MITEGESKALRSGNRYVVTTPITNATTVAGTLHMVAILTNQANSGYRVIVDSMLYFTGTGFLPSACTVFASPTDISSTAITPINLLIGSSNTDSTTILKSATNYTGLSGGVTVPGHLPNFNGDTLLGAQVAMMPGTSLGWDLSKTVVLGVNVSAYIMVYYWKELL